MFEYDPNNPNPWLWTWYGESKFPGWLSAGVLVLISAGMAFFGTYAAQPIAFSIMIAGIISLVLVRFIP